MRVSLCAPFTAAQVSRHYAERRGLSARVCKHPLPPTNLIRTEKHVRQAKPPGEPMRRTYSN